MANGAGQQASPVKPEPEWQDYKPGEQGWEDYNPSHEGALPAGSYQRRPRGPILNANISPAHTGTQAALRTFGVTRPLHGATFREDLEDAFGQVGSSLKEFGKNLPSAAAHHTLGVAGALAEPIATGLEEGSKDIDAGLFGRRGLSTDMRSVAAGVGEVAPLIAPGSEDWGEEGAARALRRPTGELRRGVRTGAGLAGGVAGATTGHSMVPGYGGVAGWFGGKELGRLASEMIPERSDTAGIKAEMEAGKAASKAQDSAAATKPSPATRTLRNEMKMSREGTSTSAPGAQTGEGPRETAPAVKETTKYPIRNKRQQAAERAREESRRTSFSAGPRDTAPAREASPVPPRGRGLRTEMAPPARTGGGGGERESAIEAARRGAPGVAPEMRSLRRHFDKARRRQGPPVIPDDVPPPKGKDRDEE